MSQNDKRSVIAGLTRNPSRNILWLMTKQGYVYMLASRPRGTLYVGVTSNLIKRIYEHKTNSVKGFTQQHNCHFLVWFEQYDTITAAIAREKQLKNWKRNWKIALLEMDNPYWQDMYNALI